MSVTDAFWTLRILPRIGSSAWKSELRASLAVPSALSPSTMNSSLRATSSLRQSASLAGNEDVSRAFLRREISFCLRADRRARISPTTLSSSSDDCALWSRFGDTKISPSSASTTFATIPRTGAVPRTSFVWPSNCGSASRTVRTAVRPAITSSFSMRSVVSRAVIFRRRAFASTALRSVRSRAASKPARCDPPFGVEMMLTNVRTSVSYPVPQRSAMSTSHSRMTSCGDMCPRPSSTGTVSLNVPDPVRCHVSVTAGSGARWSTKSTVPPACRNVSSCGPSAPGVPGIPRSSRTVIVRPGTRKLVWRARVTSSS